MTVALERELEIPLDEVRIVELDLIDPAPDNPRRQLGDLAELAQSIKAVGLLEPLVITPHGARFLLVCGARRHAACLEAGVHATACVIRTFTEAERQEAMLIENLQRVDLSVLEEATSYSRLVELGYTQRQLADRVGRSQAHISKRLAILELPKAVIAEVDSGGITLEDAQQLSKLLDYPTRLREAFRRRHEYPGVGRQVEKQLEEQKLVEKVEREEAAIKKAGIALLQMKLEGGYYPIAPKGTAVVEPDSWTQGVHMKAADHAKLSCHALAVNPKSGERVTLCRDPKSHGAKPTRDVAQSAKAKRWREHEKALRAARDERRAAAAKVVEAGLGVATRSPAVALIVDAFICRAEAEAEKVALRLLGVEPKTVKRHGYEYVDREGALVDLAATSPAAAVRVGIALALATDDICFVANGYSNAWKGDRAKVYYELLKANAGYQPAPAEKLELAGKAPRP